MVRLLEHLFTREANTTCFFIAVGFEGWKGQVSDEPSEIGMYGVMLDGENGPEEKILARSFRFMGDHAHNVVPNRRDFSCSYDEPQSCLYITIPQALKEWDKFISDLRHFN